ncbi:MAG TPA: 4Fe-4S binding protein [Candidatus Lachnoclostridium stercoripullorum]|uniref:4Fe-4S binding protein n=1 Tax=Candidatus Lachnoclostridium stercoripullorum TaxID=2838635 RepID=A0A9D1W428_9FIRM|nr:4Fe-4S binding protein [Candidatus Lachnoclostridium stercoripullorum]
MGLTLDLDLKKCTSCGACAIACMDQNDIDVERGIRPFRTVFDWESREPGCQKFIHISIACMHCPDAPCVAACPSACIAKDPETNLTIFDNTNCIGCHSCAMACPFGIPSFNEEGKMQKCDGCAVRIQNGLEPACVRACPVDALRLVSSEEIEGKDKENSLQKLGREVLEFQT